jgi:phage shock protein PspC (stress-responsive transcriptional regulator)
MIGGVCAGIAEYFGWSVTGTRVAYVLLSILSAAFPGIVVYLVLWLILPRIDFDALLRMRSPDCVSGRGV